MQKRKYAILLRLASAFFINVSAGYFFAIYATPEFLDKINASIASIACFGTAYYIEVQNKK